MSGDKHRPIGHQYALAMLDGGEERVRSLAESAGTQLTMDVFLRVQDEEPVPAFLHSALCAMSLPTKRPKDDTQPILREDGKYALAINPRPVLQTVDGKSVLKSLGVREATERYEKDKGVTTLRFAPRKKKPTP